MRVRGAAVAAGGLMGRRLPGKSPRARLGPTGTRNLRAEKNKKTKRGRTPGASERGATRRKPRVGLVCRATCRVPGRNQQRRERWVPTHLSSCTQGTRPGCRTVPHCARPSKEAQQVGGGRSLTHGLDPRSSRLSTPAARPHLHLDDRGASTHVRGRPPVTGASRRERELVRLTPPTCRHSTA